jgi:hypothetical protein
MASQEFLNLIEPDEAEKKRATVLLIIQMTFSKMKRNNNKTQFFFLSGSSSWFSFRIEWGPFLIFSKNLVFQFEPKLQQKMLSRTAHKFKL